MNILSTGLSSFMGKKLLQSIDKDIKFINIGRRNYIDLPENVENISFNDNRLEEKIKKFKPSIFINLASISRSSNNNLSEIRKIVDLNISLSTHLVNIAIDSKVEKIVNISTNWAYMDSKRDSKFFNFYAFTKFALDKYIYNVSNNNHSKAISLILYDNFDKYDPRNKIFNILYNSIFNGKITDLSPGQQIINLTRMDDLIEALKFIIFTKWKFDNHKYYQITGQEISILKLSKMIQKITQRNSEFLKFGSLPYRAGEIMHPEYFFEELPFKGNRKDNIFESIKKELSK